MKQSFPMSFTSEISTLSLAVTWNGFFKRKIFKLFHSKSESQDVIEGSYVLVHRVSDNLRFFHDQQEEETFQDCYMGIYVSVTALDIIDVSNLLIDRVSIIHFGRIIWIIHYFTCKWELWEKNGKPWKNQIYQICRKVLSVFRVDCKAQTEYDYKHIAFANVRISRYIWTASSLSCWEK